MTGTDDGIKEDWARLSVVVWNGFKGVAMAQDRNEPMIPF